MVTGKEGLPLGEAIQAYHLEQRARGVSPHTARAQAGDLGKLLDHALRARWESWNSVRRPSWVAVSAPTFPAPA